MCKSILILGILLTYTIANSADTIYYTTNGSEVTVSMPDWINSQNPPCAENDRVYTGRYDDIRFDLNGCYRWRPWLCVASNLKGVDVEILPVYLCRPRSTDKQ